MDRLIGRTDVEDLLDLIFRGFCIGKQRGGAARSAFGKRPRLFPSIVAQHEAAAFGVACGPPSVQPYLAQRAPSAISPLAKRITHLPCVLAPEPACRLRRRNRRPAASASVPRPTAASAGTGPGPGKLAPHGKVVIVEGMEQVAAGLVGEFETSNWRTSPSVPAHFGDRAAGGPAVLRLLPLPRHTRP